MIRQPPRTTRTDTLLPYTTLFLFAIVDSPKALREGKRRSGNQFANKAGSIVVGVIPLVVPNGSIEAKGFPKFDLVAIARLLGAQHRSNSLDRLPRIAPLALHSRLKIGRAHV